MNKFHNHIHLDGGTVITAVCEYNDQAMCLEVGMAVCSNRDNWNRRKGNMIAKGRLDKGRLFASIPMKGEPSVEMWKSYMLETKVKIADQVEQENVTPKNLRVARIVDVTKA